MKRWGETPSSPDSKGQKLGLDGVSPYRFMESEHLQNSNVSWGHEPGRRPAEWDWLPACQPRTGKMPVPLLRFMESPHDSGIAHRDDEPPRHRLQSGTRFQPVNSEQARSRSGLHGRPGKEA